MIARLKSAIAPAGSCAARARNDNGKRRRSGSSPTQTRLSLRSAAERTRAAKDGTPVNVPSCLEGGGRRAEGGGQNDLPTSYRRSSNPFCLPLSALRPQLFVVQQLPELIERDIPAADDEADLPSPQLVPADGRG